MRGGATLPDLRVDDAADSERMIPLTTAPFTGKEIKQPAPARKERGLPREQSLRTVDLSMRNGKVRATAAK